MQLSRGEMKGVSKMKAEFGWTVVRLSVDPKQLVGAQAFPTFGFFVYKRDCKADGWHGTDDLVPFTFPTKKIAIEEGKKGNYAYKRK
jgi:hypothetical protein